MREGEKNGRHKLTEPEVRIIKKVWNKYKRVRKPLPWAHNNKLVSIEKLANKHDVSTGTMGALLTEKTWGHVKI